MNDAIMILSEEKQRLENGVALSRQRLREVYAPAIAQRPSRNLQGQEIMITYIDMDRFTPEQREQFDNYSKVADGDRARLCVFENYVKGFVSQETIQSYNQYVQPVDDFKEVTVSCNQIDLNENGELSKCSIKVGPANVESPREMSFEQYLQLYTSSLNDLLVKCLGEDLSPEQVMQQLQTVCTDVYLQQKEKGTMTV